MFACSRFMLCVTSLQRRPVLLKANLVGGVLNSQQKPAFLRIPSSWNRREGNEACKFMRYNGMVLGSDLLVFSEVAIFETFKNTATNSSENN